MGNKMKKFTTTINLDEIEGNATFSMAIECAFCCDGYEENVNEMQDRKEMQQEFVDSLNDAGWLMLNSSEFMQIGFACPNCIAQEIQYRKDHGHKRI